MWQDWGQSYLPSEQWDSSFCEAPIENTQNKFYLLDKGAKVLMCSIVEILTEIYANDRGKQNVEFMDVLCTMKYVARALFLHHWSFF